MKLLFPRFLTKLSKSAKSCIAVSFFLSSVFFTTAARGEITTNDLETIIVAALNAYNESASSPWATIVVGEQFNAYLEPQIQRLKDYLTSTRDYVRKINDNGVKWSQLKPYLESQGLISVTNDVLSPFLFGGREGVLNYDNSWVNFVQTFYTLDSYLEHLLAYSLPFSSLQGQDWWWVKDKNSDQINDYLSEIASRSSQESSEMQDIIEQLGGSSGTNNMGDTIISIGVDLNNVLLNQQHILERLGFGNNHSLETALGYQNGTESLHSDLTDIEIQNHQDLTLVNNKLGNLSSEVSSIREDLDSYIDKVTFNSSEELNTQTDAIDDWDTSDESSSTNQPREFVITRPVITDMEPMFDIPSVESMFPTFTDGDPTLDVLPSQGFRIDLSLPDSFADLISLVSYWLWKILYWCGAFFILRQEWGFWSTLGGSSNA